MALICNQGLGFGLPTEILMEGQRRSLKLGEVGSSSPGEQPWRGRSGEGLPWREESNVNRRPSPGGWRDAGSAGAGGAEWS